MSELYDDEIIDTEDEFAAAEEVLQDKNNLSSADARRRLEKKLEEMRLKHELEDFRDYE